VRDRCRARSEDHRFAYVEASWRVPSIIFRVKPVGHLQYSHPRSNPCAVFNLQYSTLLLADKGAFHNPEFSNSQFPKNTANTYGSYLRSHVSQQTLRLSLRRGAERRFINNIYTLTTVTTYHSTTHCVLLYHHGTHNCNIHSKLISTVSGPSQIAYPPFSFLPSSVRSILFYIA